MYCTYIHVLKIAQKVSGALEMALRSHIAKRIPRAQPTLTNKRRTHLQRELFKVIISIDKRH